MIVCCLCATANMVMWCLPQAATAGIPCCCSCVLDTADVVVVVAAAAATAAAAASAPAAYEQGGSRCAKPRALIVYTYNLASQGACDTDTIHQTLFTVGVGGTHQEDPLLAH